MPLSVEPGTKPLVLVTGAAGKIGRHVTENLLRAGFAVRALTTKPVDPARKPENLEWRSFDFMRCLDFELQVDGCAAVVHLAAEIVDRAKMQLVNVEATQALAKAANAAGVGVFCYVSSASVYGSSLTRVVNESSPTISPAFEVKGEHWAPPAVRHYARTKLLGERHAIEAAADMTLIIVRPTVVVDAGDVAKLARRSRLRKSLIGRRHAHHVYVADVAEAIAWLVEHAMAAHPSAASVAIYNIAEDDVACRSYSEIARRLRQPGAPIAMPSLVDQLVEFARYGALPWRHSMGRMMFSGESLTRRGFRFPHGIERLYAEMSKGGLE